MNGKGAREDKENKQKKKKKKKCSKKTVRPENLTQCYGLGCLHEGTLRAFTVFFLWIIMTVIFGMSFKVFSSDCNFL